MNTPNTTAATAVAHSFDQPDDARAPAAPLADFRAGVRAGRYPVVPDAVTVALDARKHLEDHRARIYEGAPERYGLAGSLLAALIEGKDVTAALDAAVDGQLDLDRRDVAAGLLRLAIGDADRFLRETITKALPEILAGLRAELDATVHTLRAAYDDAGGLDVHQPDPMEVAQATQRQRDALVTIAEETKAYRRIRSAQRGALAASDLPIPGDNEWRAGYSWADFFATGLHEVQHPGGYGLPGKNAAPRNAVKAVASRKDVWLPDPDQMTAAYERLQKALKTVPTAAAKPAPQLGEFPAPAAAYLDATTHNRGVRR